MSLIGYVQKNVSAREYYQDVFVETEKTDRWPEKGEVRVKCCFHPDGNPSLYCNLETGKWYCHGCGMGGKSIISFDSLLNTCSHEESAEALFHHYVHPVIPQAKVNEWSVTLRKTPSFLNYLRKNRVLKDSIISAYLIGYDGHRLTIPVYNEYGLAVNAKLYEPSKNRGQMPKMLQYTDPNEERKFGVPTMLYPLSAMQLAKRLGFVIVCEGEWDALALISIGVPAVSSTHGCKSWPEQYNQLFHGLRVGIAYDNDSDGKTYARVPAKELSKVTRSISRIQVPPVVGKDVTDWLLHDENARSLDFWKELLETSEVWSENENPEVVDETAEPEQVTLDQATSPVHARKTIRVDCLVSGKGTAPYHLPKKYRASCAKTCEHCPMSETGAEFTEVTLEKSDPFLLDLANSSKSRVKALLLNKAGIQAKASCFGEIEEVETVSLEQLLLIPTLDSESREYVTRTGYYVGHGLRANCGYRFIGATIPHPKDQQATHLFTVAKPLKDEVDTFSLQPDMREKLRVFQPEGPILEHLEGIAEWQSREITKIRERPDLHIIVDLAFHSVRSFSFNGEFIRRGMLDVLVIGDTRCGKGFVTEGLCRYYGLGEVASGENCSFAGLVGGVQHIGDRWFVTWGLVPLNNNRLVVIDEASALSESDFGHMSRVRSEGVAEISKIVRESTQANTRLIWLANSRSGSPMASYNTGVEAVKELVGANEDISRFDAVLSVATDEVNPEVINNAQQLGHHDPGRYSSDICRALILWAWSRKPDDIEFSDQAVSKIIEASIELGRKYSAAIPLVQSENIRIKIAKISASIAARCFSTDEDGQKLVIKRQHVNAAVALLNQFYTKSSMGYDRFSERAIATTTIANVDRITQILKNTGANAARLVGGLLNLHRVTTSNLSDYVGGDAVIARCLISDLVMENCLRLEGERGQTYLKNPAFRDWLKKYQTTITHADHI